MLIERTYYMPDPVQAPGHIAMYRLMEMVPVLMEFREAQPSKQLQCSVGLARWVCDFPHYFLFLQTFKIFYKVFAKKCICYLFI